MDQATIASTTAYFITSIKDYISDNLGTVLLFSAGILVWGVLKKWVFGATPRV